MNKKVDYLSFPAIVGTPGHYNNWRKTCDAQHYKYHMDRMGKSKPMVDNEAPRTYLHCHLNMKKMQMEQELLMNNNRLLASRIARIMDTKGDVDCWNQYPLKPSMNAGLRKREQVKISWDNEAIWKKISLTKSVYDHRKWLDDFKVTRGYMDRLLKYPKPPGPTRQRQELNLV